MNIIQKFKVRTGTIGQRCKSLYNKLLKWRRCRCTEVIQLLTCAILLATLIVFFNQTNTLLRQTDIIQSDYTARTQPHLAIESASVEQDNGAIYVVLGILNTGEVPVTNLDVVKMRMGGTWLSSGPYVYAPEYHDFPIDLVFLPGRCNHIPIHVENDIWDASFREGKAIEIELTYVWEGTTYYYVANGKMGYDSDSKQYVDVYYDRERHYPALIN